jgi:hypothetical protein
VNELEHRVLDMVLRGNHPTLAVLRAQMIVARVLNRQFTGVGFFTDFVVPPTAPRLTAPSEAHLGHDVCATIPGLEGGIGFVLALKDGLLGFLEGFTYGDEQFPDEMTGIRFSYLRPRYPGSAETIETVERDLNYALGVLG